jgi:hypothetical protein
MAEVNPSADRVEQVVPSEFSTFVVHTKAPAEIDKCYVCASKFSKNQKEFFEPQDHVLNPSGKVVCCCHLCSVELASYWSMWGPAKTQSYIQLWNGLDEEKLAKLEQSRLKRKMTKRTTTLAKKK